MSILYLYGENIKWKEIALFIFTQGTVLQFWTPDSLRGYGVGTPNGSLWTIGVMVQSYIAIWFIYKILHNKSKKWWLILLTLGVGFNIGSPILSEIMPVLVYKLFNQTFLPYVWMFIVGAMICEFYNEIIGFIKKYWLVFLVAASVASITGWDVGIYGTIKVFSLAFAIIGFAYSYPQIKINHDISYGFYIYHMIIINVMVHLGYIKEWKYLVISFVLSIILAFISYFTLGKVGRIKK